jgi:mRNA-degrading endonuclease RelE of RelBE toxin-antitoxin system
MTSEPGRIQVEITAYFQNKLKRLYRKYRHVVADVQSLIDQLERGETPGDRIQHLSYVVYKVRVKNTDLEKGKSGGYRVIYYVRHQDHLLLISIYSKSELSDLSADVIRSVIDDYEQSRE